MSGWLSVAAEALRSHPLSALTPAAVLAVSYLIGSVPFSYLLVKGITGEDITDHGTGNVGAMNVRRSTGSWGWFAVAMVLDGMKGLVPALGAKLLVFGFTWAALAPFSSHMGLLRSPAVALLVLSPMLAVAGSVLGHNYSVWLALLKHRYVRTGKGLATGGGALLAYDWRYFVVSLVTALLVIALTRYLMAGQVAASWALPVFSIATRSADWPFALLMGTIVYAAHHKRFVGLLRGREPKLYIGDRMGPRG